VLKEVCLWQCDTPSRWLEVCCSQRSMPHGAHLVCHLSTQGALLVKAAQQQTGTCVDAGVFVAVAAFGGMQADKNCFLRAGTSSLLVLVLLLLLLPLLQCCFYARWTCWYNVNRSLSQCRLLKDARKVDANRCQWCAWLHRCLP
jgi:hypothetical protein